MTMGCLLWRTAAAPCNGAQWSSADYSQYYHSSVKATVYSKGTKARGAMVPSTWNFEWCQDRQAELQLQHAGELLRKF